MRWIVYDLAMVVFFLGSTGLGWQLAKKKYVCSHPNLYYCPTSEQNECKDCGGFDVCCDHPWLHEKSHYIDYDKRDREKAKNGEDNAATKG